MKKSVLLGVLLSLNVLALPLVSAEASSTVVSDHKVLPQEVITSQQVNGLVETGIQYDSLTKDVYLKASMTQFWADAKAGRLAKFVVPTGWTMHELDVNGIVVEQLKSNEKKSDRVVLQLHGGGYVAGMSDNHRRMGLDQALITGASEVYYLNYRLAPQNVYPAALEDAFATYQQILKQGTKAENIILVGDSAGAHLSLSLVAFLKTQNVEQPGVIILQSPWTTFETTGATRTANNAQDYILGLGTPLNQAVIDASYAGTIQDRKDPRISPIYGDLSNLAPILIQTGGHELFVSDSYSLAEKITADGGVVSLSIYPGMSHDFMLLFPELRETNNTLLEIRDFVNRYLK